MLIALLLFLASFGAVLVLERFVHKRLQEVLFIITGHKESATLFFSIALLPGVALHELSHAAAAAVLGVRVRKISLKPERMKNGVVRLGYVEMLRTDTLRSSLIGAAPLVAGLTTLIAIGFFVFNLEAMQSALTSGAPRLLLDQLLAIGNATDSWLWVYLIFAIANSMMPSTSDVESWPPVVGFLAVFSAGLLLLGGTDLVAAISPAAQFVLRWLTAAFALTAFIDMVVVIGLWVTARAISLLTGRRLDYR
jgi:hypothetical protein